MSLMINWQKSNLNSKVRNKIHKSKRRAYFLITFLTLFFISIVVQHTYAYSLTTHTNYQLDNGSSIYYSFNKSLSKPNVQIVHRIMPGETMYSISRKYYDSTEFVQDIVFNNNIKNPSTDLKIGNTLNISNPRLLDTYRVKSGDTIFKITQQYFSSDWFTDYIQRINGIQNPNIDTKSGVKIVIPLPGAIVSHTVQPGETLYRIVLRHFQVSKFQSFITNYNDINSGSVKIGSEVKIPNPYFVEKKVVSRHKVEKYNNFIEIDRSKNTLLLYKNKKLVRSFRVATGKNSDPTPVGNYKIANKIKDPWYSPEGIPGKDSRNPLGTRWLGLSVPNTGGTKYGIHGTNDPGSIGQSVSLGCIRMNNADVQWLYDNVSIGTVVIIKN